MPLKVTIDKCYHLFKQFGRRIIGLYAAIILVEAIADQPVHQLFIFFKSDPLESADPDMAMAQPGHDRRAGGRGFVATGQFFPRLDHRECL